MNIFAYLAMIAGFIVIFGETIYARQQTKDGQKFSKEDYTTNVFVGTLIGILFFGIGATLYLYNNYNESTVFTILLITIAASIYISLMTFGLTASRLRFATSS